MTNTDGDKIAAAFLQHKPAQTSQVAFMDGRSGRRLTTDGESVKSYGWWTVAQWLDSSTLIAITTERYQTGWWKSGKAKYSPTTDAHIGSVTQAVVARGFRPTGHYRDIDGTMFEVYER